MSKRVGVVCATYRSPEKNSLVREYGTIALIDQMFSQDYDGELFISLVDSSPEPHPFFAEIQEKYSDRLIYLHVPSRNDIDNVREKFPEAARFIPTDEQLKAGMIQDIDSRLERGKSVLASEIKLAQGDFDLSLEEWDEIIGKRPSSSLQMAFNSCSGASQTNLQGVDFWAKRLGEAKAFAKFVPFDKDYPIQTNIFSQLFIDRPTIGMKKNVGVQALAEKFGPMDAIVFSDDDDHHAPDYVRQSVDALGDGHFTRMTRYITHKFSKEGPAQWGIFDLQIEKDDNNYWVLPADQEDRDMKCFGPQGPYLMKVGDKFSRPVTMAWPIISHEGRLHTISFDAWKKSVEAFGGAVPVSFCEDIIYYRKLRDALGSDFKDSLTPVTPGKESFICISDGANASVIETMEDLNMDDLPQWAGKAVELLYEAAQAGPLASHPNTLSVLGKQFAEKGELNLHEALVDTMAKASANLAPTASFEMK